MKAIQNWASIVVTLAFIFGGIIFTYGSLNARVKANEGELTELKDSLNETVLRMESKIDKLNMQIADVDRKVERLLGYKEGRRSNK